MINFKRIKSLALKSSFLLLVLPFSPLEAASSFEAGKAVNVMGSKMSAGVSAGVRSADQSVSNLNLDAFGKTANALQTVSTANVNGTTYTEFYSFNKKIFSDASFVSNEGGTLRLGLAPTQIRAPLVVYPVGPLVLEADAGVRFQANLALENATVISIPIQYSEPGLKLSAVASAAGFVEGHANVLIIRGGVGGQVDLVDAHLDIHSRFMPEHKTATVEVSAIAQFLKGRFYAFLDVFGFLSAGWERFIDEDLYSWKGYCVATENRTCP